MRVCVRVRVCIHMYIYVCMFMYTTTHNDMHSLGLSLGCRQMRVQLMSKIRTLSIAFLKWNTMFQMLSARRLHERP